MSVFVVCDAGLRKQFVRLEYKGIRSWSELFHQFVCGIWKIFYELGRTGDILTQKRKRFVFRQIFEVIELFGSVSTFCAGDQRIYCIRREYIDPSFFQRI
jgi:hypothetical protein